MNSDVEKRLKDLGFELPDAPAPAANYVPFVEAGGQLWISGQVSSDRNGVIAGVLGQSLDTEAGRAAAERCALAILAQAKTAIGGDWSRIARLVKLTGFVASAPGFADQPKVVNGASDLMVGVFGEAGRHARSAIGVAALPLGAAVEIEAVFLLA